LGAGTPHLGLVTKKTNPEKTQFRFISRFETGKKNKGKIKLTSTLPKRGS